MKEVVITSKVVGREGAGVPAKIGQGSTVDLSAYLLKGIWDKVWEIRTDSTGKEYIFGKLPVVTQYGITMYAGDGGDIDLPSLYAGLPIDNTTIYWDNGVLKAVGSSGGGGVADSVAWSNIQGKPIWITDTKPVYSYTEIEDVPDLSVYATNKALEALGLIVNKKADKSYVDDNFVTIATNQDITGLKTFVNGLYVGNNKIYQSQDDVIYLDGNLVVRGGITMYGTDSVEGTSIMESLLLDSSTLKLNEKGELTVVGGSGGLNVTELQNYLTQNSYLNVTEGDGRYLKLSGGTISGSINFGEYGAILGFGTNSEYTGGMTVDSTIIGSYEVGAIIRTSGDNLYHYRHDVNSRYKILDTNNYSAYVLPLTGGTISASSVAPLIISAYGMGNVSAIGFNNGDTVLGYLGVSAKDIPMFRDTSGNTYTLLHSGDEASLMKHYRTSNIDLNSIITTRPRIVEVNTSTNNAPTTNQWHQVMNWGSGDSAYGCQIANCYTRLDSSLYYRFKVGGSWSNWRTIASTADNVASATKLQTARTIWGQSFDGTRNIDGDFFQRKFGSYGGDGSEFYILNKAAADVEGREGWLRWVFETAYARFKRLDIVGNSDSLTIIASFLSNGCVGIGTTSPVEKLHIIGNLRLQPTDRSDVSISFVSEQMGDAYYDFKIGKFTDVNSKTSFGFAMNQSDGTWKKFFNITTGSSYDVQSVDILTGLNVSGNVGVRGSASVEHNNAATDGSPAFTISRNTSGDAMIINNTGTTNNTFIRGGIYFKNLDSNNLFWHVFPSASLYVNGLGNKSVPSYNVEIGTFTLGSWNDNKMSFYVDTINKTVGIGTVAPAYTLHVAGDFGVDGIAAFAGEVWLGDDLHTYDILPRSSETYSCGYSNARWYQVYSYIGNFSGKITATGGLEGNYWGINDTPHNPYLWLVHGGYNWYIQAYNNSYIYLGRGVNYSLRIDTSGNVLTPGGITMYSDKRKKTILRDVELSLKEIANAPLIEHYYNSDDKKTTHVGSIAQYWAGLNDWFCKLDNEGYYTMEIQNAALASAISIARELDRYETKTDKQIKKLKKRICELEEEVELLKAS